MSLTEFEKVLERYQEGTCTPAEKRWIENWMAKHQLFQDNSWDQLSKPEKQSLLQDLFQRIEVDIKTQENTGYVNNTEVPVNNASIWRSRLVWWSAAMLAAILTVSFYIYSVHQASQQELPQASEWVHLDVAQGERKKITLGDGTAIWIQGGSRLRYPRTFSGADTRTVKFEGEGYFEVTENKQQPFIVQSKYLQAEVLGTSFNVQAYEGLPQQQISLVEGELLVSLIASDQDQFNREDSHQQQIHLMSSQTAFLDLSTQRLTTEEGVGYNTAEDFKEGNLQFEETVLSEVLYRVAQKYGVQIEYDALTADKHKISAIYYNRDPVKEVIRSIAESTGSHYQWKNDKQVIFKP